MMLDQRERMNYEQELRKTDRDTEAILHRIDKAPGAMSNGDKEIATALCCLTKAVLHLAYIQLNG